MITRTSNTNLTASGEISMSGNVSEVEQVIISSLDLDAVSYNIEVTGLGGVSSDVDVYQSIVTKIIA